MTGKVAFLESEWIRRCATVLALEGRLDEAVAEFRRGIALCERQGWYAGLAYVELLVGLGALYAQIGQKQRAGRAFDDALQALAAGRRQQGAAFDDVCIRAAKLAAEGAVHAHSALLARASQLQRWRTDRAEKERHRRADMESSNITAIMRRVHEFDPTPGIRIVMAEDALLEARSHTRVAPLADDCAPWELVPPTWYATASYTPSPLGAEPDQDPDSTESWVRQVASVPIDDVAANDLLDRALAGIDPDSLSPEDEEASEVARQVTEALTAVGTSGVRAVPRIVAPSARGVTVDSTRHTRRGCAIRGCRTHIRRLAARRTRRCASRSRPAARPTSGPLLSGTGVAIAGHGSRFA